MGLTLADFEALTPVEFEAAYKSFAERAERAERGAWERTRTLVVATLAPYSRAGTDPQRVLPLPWDTAAGAEAAEEHTATELAERYRAAAAARGLCIGEEVESI